MGPWPRNADVQGWTCLQFLGLRMSTAGYFLMWRGIFVGQGAEVGVTIIHLQDHSVRVSLFDICEFVL
jgi:hypothetical protein